MCFIAEISLLQRRGDRERLPVRYCTLGTRDSARSVSWAFMLSIYSHQQWDFSLMIQGGRALIIQSNFVPVYFQFVDPIPTCVVTAHVSSVSQGPSHSG